VCPPWHSACQWASSRPMTSRSAQSAWKRLDAVRLGLITSRGSGDTFMIPSTNAQGTIRTSLDSRGPSSTSGAENTGNWYMILTKMTIVLYHCSAFQKSGDMWGNAISDRTTARAFRHAATDM